jgi:hypothetical protein
LANCRSDIPKVDVPIFQNVDGVLVDKIKPEIDADGLHHLDVEIQKLFDDRRRNRRQRRFVDVDAKIFLNVVMTSSLSVDNDDVDVVRRGKRR